MQHPLPLPPQAFCQFLQGGQHPPFPSLGAEGHFTWINHAMKGLIWAIMSHFLQLLLGCPSVWKWAMQGSAWFGKWEEVGEGQMPCLWEATRCMHAFYHTIMAPNCSDFYALIKMFADKRFRKAGSSYCGRTHWSFQKLRKPTSPVFFYAL